MNLLFVSGLFQKEREEEFFSKFKMFPYAAANVHQWHILEGLVEREGLNVEVVNAAFVGTYPREYKDAYIHAGNWEYKGIHVRETGFVNLFGIRSIARAAGVYRGIVRWWKRDQEGENTAVLYSMLTPFMLAGALAKRRCKGLKLCLYVPDLPGSFLQIGGKGRIYRLLKRLDCALMNRLLRHIDSFALLTEQMNEKLNPQKQKPYVVLEGIVSQEDAPEVEHPIGGKMPSFVYTGLIDRAFGVLDLAQAFTLLEGDCTLELYGEGEALDTIRQMARKDPRIRCHGAVPREEALLRQREATVLINPRMPDKDFVRYSFPSKTLEYLLSGRPVLMFQLEGIPAEYDPYLSFFPSADHGEMAKAMKQLLETPKEELTARGKRGREFVLEEKNERKQGEKLITLLKRS